ncbi:hypothetical protein GCM10023231_04850 [Olivibacter ginsenosidimutans]|uniref:HD/PDEase domain-containing protein n=1 Tax=Olivibacter ginsenosidimutans TaxID=1176537 RepID=A0ABP9AFJ2_9SPHI
MQFDLVLPFLLNKLKHELPPTLKYHNVAHTEDVLHAAQEIAHAEQVAGQDLTVLLTAALFHDTGFMVSNVNHEHISCAIADRYLPQFNYPNSTIGDIKTLIMATCVPQKPQDHLQQIICDADLDYLGRDDFFATSERLYEEMLALHQVSSKRDYMNLQIAFLQEHHYFTDTSKRLRNPKKEKHLQTIKKNYLNIP